MGRRTRGFHVEGHHYAIVIITGPAPGRRYVYAITLDGERAWPPSECPFPPSMNHTPHADRPLKLVLDSCRVSLPYVLILCLRERMRGRGVGALYALASRLCHEPAENWPHMLVFLGDHIYADAVSPGARDFIRTHRDVARPLG